MSYTALYRAWRPQTFSEVVGQENVIRTLRNQVESGRIANTYLFCGSRGTGKTTAAKIFARAVNCENNDAGDPCGKCPSCLALMKENTMDVLEIDAASNNGVDEIRDLRERVQYPPTAVRRKVYIIDEVHMLSQGAFNALLKTLEEPPKHAVFILATTDPQKIPATVLSRCQRFDFKRIALGDIVGRLKTVLKGIGREAEEDALNEIGRAAEGALRDALSLLDVCLAYTDGIVTAELAREVLGTVGRDFMFAYADALLSYNAKAAIELLDEAMLRGSDPRTFALDVCGHLRNLLLAKKAQSGLDRLLEVTPEDAQRYVDQAKEAGENHLTRALDIYLHLDNELRNASQPRTILELAAVRVCHPEEEKAPDAEERLERLEKLMKNGVRVTSAAPKETEEKKKEAPAPKPKPSLPEGEQLKPTEEDTELYEQAVRAAAEVSPASRGIFPKLQFIGYQDGKIYVNYKSTEMTAVGVLQRREKDLNDVFSNVFGEKVTLVFQKEGTPVKKLGRDTKRNIEESYEIFGRENVTLTDEP